MNKILVTGGAGFIGSHIVDELIENGDKVVIVDNLSTGNMGNVNKKAKFYELDITSRELEKIFKIERPGYVIHHAAQIDIQKSITNPIFDGKINILGTLNLLECCKKYKVGKIIYASSAAVYGEPEYLGIDEKHSIKPISYYGISKYTPELYIKVYSKLYGIKYTILRYANAYGIRQDPKGEGGVVSIFMDKLFKGENPIIFGTGKQTRDFIYVKDIVKANILAIDRGDNEIFNIGTGIKTNINELSTVMKNIFNLKLNSIHKEGRKGEIENSYFNISKVEEVLGWQPDYSLVEGLEETINYYREFIDAEHLVVSTKEE